MVQRTMVYNFRRKLRRSKSLAVKVSLLSPRHVTTGKCFAFITLPFSIHGLINSSANIQHNAVTRIMYLYHVDRELPICTVFECVDHATGLRPITPTFNVIKK